MSDKFLVISVALVVIGVTLHLTYVIAFIFVADRPWVVYRDDWLSVLRFNLFFYVWPYLALALIGVGLLCFTVFFAVPKIRHRSS